MQGVLDQAGIGDLPVRGVLCFVEADWPLIGGDFTVDGVEVLWPKKLAERLTAKEPAHSLERIESAYRGLARALHLSDGRTPPTSQATSACRPTSTPSWCAWPMRRAGPRAPSCVTLQ